NQRILALIERVRPNGGHEEVASEVVASVDHLDLDGAGRDRALANCRLLTLRQLPNVDRARDDLNTPLLAHPAHRNRRIEPARVGEHHPFAHQSPANPANWEATSAP